MGLLASLCGGDDARACERARATAAAGALEPIVAAVANAFAFQAGDTVHYKVGPRSFHHPEVSMVSMVGLACLATIARRSDELLGAVRAAGGRVPRTSGCAAGRTLVVVQHGGVRLTESHEGSV